MTPIFLTSAAVALMLALSLLLWLPQQRHNTSIERLRQAAAKLRALGQTRSDGVAVDDKDDASLPAAIDATLRATIEVERTGRRPAVCAGVALLLLVPLAVMSTYRAANSLQAQHFGAAHAGAGGASAPPIDHGSDMQAAIAKLSDKLRQHPDDAEGWALLGRTYKAMQEYPKAREAFGRAVAAAPADRDLAQEYAAAETPNPAPPTTDSLPLACPAPGTDYEECGDGEREPTSSIRKAALAPQLQGLSKESRPAR
jgi:cytochrome c-type biogenesis protein CcmH